MDLGTYSVSVSDTDGVSSSFVLDEEGNTCRTEAGLLGFYIKHLQGLTLTEKDISLEKGSVFVGGWGWEIFINSPRLLWKLNRLYSVHCIY